MEEKDFVETHFKYTDEFGDVTELRKTHPVVRVVDDGNTYFLMEEFKVFLRSCGYSNNWINRIQYVEDDEEIVEKK